ncbi:MAG: PEP-CTERM sorting domain-containing protein [Acidobacteria bacterium]|nr:PEP-CTERM sorting domain-containing protein [Acidobacteriota bacterium]
MNKLLFFPLLAVAASALPAWGATLNSNTVTFDFTSASSVLTFDQFDTALGTLTKVEMVFLSGSRTVITGRPTGAFDGGCGGNYNYTAYVDAGGEVTTVGGAGGSLTSSTCGITDFNIHTFNPPRTISRTPTLNLFEGTGTLDVTLGRSPILVTNITGASVRFDGDAQFRYTYDPVPTVPEPSTWALLGAGSLVLFTRRRQSR